MLSEEIVVGEVDWMRNDYAYPITIGNITYPTLEHAYQGAKFTSKSIKEQIAAAQTVAEARKIGRQKKDIRSDWGVIKFDTMTYLIRLKFSSDEILADRLAKTGNTPIVMNGYDSFWGIGNGDGQNNLGNILENIRSEIQFLRNTKVEDEQDSVLTLKDIIINPTDETQLEDMADACQNLFDGSLELLTLVDSKDFDARYISRKIGISIEQAEESVKKLQKWQSACNTLKDFLTKIDNRDNLNVSEQDEWEFDHSDDHDENDEWLDNNLD